MLDIIIKDGRIADGTGSPWFYADIGIKNGRIAFVSRKKAEARHVVSARKLTVSPGFIDAHTHSERITELPEAKNFIRQGVSTVISGNCGESPLRIKNHLDDVKTAEPGVNYAVLAGHGAIRKHIMGMDKRLPAAGDLARMRKLVEISMKAGALGISTGLFYVPGAYAGIRELIELAKTAAEMNGVYATHARSAGGKLFEAVEEAASIGEKARIPVEISHLKALHKKGRTRKDRIDEVLKSIEHFRARGCDITCDIHPYPATFTTLASVVIPPEASEGGKLKERLGNEKFRNKIRREVRNNISWIGGPDKITVTQCKEYSHMAGKTLAELADYAHIDPIDLAMNLSGGGEPRAIFHALREKDVSKIIASRNSMIASDGGIRARSELVHPRYYGTFPRIFREYVREKKILSLEEAVRKMTSFPAAKFGILDRGILRPGMKADVAIFNHETFRDTATFANPASFPIGLNGLIINGYIVWDGKKISPSRRGAIIKKHPGMSGPQ